MAATDQVGEAVKSRPAATSRGIPTAGRVDILYGVSKTSVEIDRDIAARAADILGTVTLRDTIDSALREIVNARRRLELVAMFSEADRFDFSAAENAWGGDH